MLWDIDIIPIVENQKDNNMEHEVNTAVILGFRV